MNMFFWKKKLDFKIFFGIETQFFKRKKLFFINLIKLMFIYLKISDLDLLF